MPEIILYDDEPVDIGAGEAVLELQVGGKFGDGVVEVLRQPGRAHIDTVATGTGGHIPVAGSASVVLHYHRAPKGPDAVDVEYEFHSDTALG